MVGKVLQTIPLVDVAVGGGLASAGERCRLFAALVHSCFLMPFGAEPFGELG